MNYQEDRNRKSNIIIYTTEDGLAKIETTFDEDTVWRRLKYSRRSFKNLFYIFKHRHLLALAGLYNAHDPTVHFISGFFTETSCYFLPVFTFPQITFTHVVLKWHCEIMKEKQVVLFIFFQPVQ